MSGVSLAAIFGGFFGVFLVVNYQRKKSNNKSD